MKRWNRIAVLSLVAAVCLWPAGCEPPTIAVTETPIQVTEETTGHGRAARAGDIVCIDYRVLLSDGQEILREEDFRFHLGVGAVIAGFDEGIPGMQPGGKRIVRCPPHKHWGSTGYGKGKIPPHSTLTLHIKLNSIE
jgi:FKBP-type peptidyl-prolyl cis-trans isomerase